VPTVAAAWQVWYSWSAGRYVSHGLALHLGDPGRLLTGLLNHPSVRCQGIACRDHPLKRDYSTSSLFGWCSTSYCSAGSEIDIYWSSCPTHAHELQVLLSRFRIVVASISLVLALTAGLWTRGELERHEAWWRAAESARAAGVEPGAIFGAWEWTFHYTFAHYIRYCISDDLNDLWKRWLPERYRQAN
jgi:hypothetical protein